MAARKKKVAKKRRAKTKLLDKHQDAIVQLIKDPDLKTCATVIGYSYNYVRQLVVKPFFKKALQDAKNKVAEKVIEKTAIDSAEVLKRAETYLNTSITDFLVIPENGEPYFDFGMASKEQLSAIDGIEIVPGKYGTRIKVTMAKRKELLELIGKHVKINAFKETDDDDVPIDQNWKVTIVHTNARTDPSR
ncbi:MAG TPA: hypothetical protein ENJ35_04270 [Gammaproteobacteria bacterium]|nr:hypothetical protein [Gammaproteobacteria bacterium]